MLLPRGYLLGIPQGPERPASGDGYCVPQAWVTDETQCQNPSCRSQVRQMQSTPPPAPTEGGAFQGGILHLHLEQSKQLRRAEPLEPFQRPERVTETSDALRGSARCRGDYGAPTCHGRLWKV